MFSDKISFDKIAYSITEFFSNDSSDELAGVIKEYVNNKINSGLIIPTLKSIATSVIKLQTTCDQFCKRQMTK